MQALKFTYIVAAFEQVTEPFMALKPTIYKFDIALSDMERNYYTALNLTVAQHPSETLERMMVRLMAYCLNAEEHLEFTKGLSTPDSPDICLNSLDGQLITWIDVGEPAFDRIKKATRQAKNVSVYSFNTKSDVWWSQSQADFSGLKAQVFQFDWAEVQKLASLVTRTTSLSVSIAEQTLYVSADTGDAELQVKSLQVPST